MNRIFELIDAFPGKNWNLEAICSRDDITFEFIYAHRKRYNPAASLDIVLMAV
jgi:hypothetical protein